MNAIHDRLEQTQSFDFTSAIFHELKRVKDVGHALLLDHGLRTREGWTRQQLEAFQQRQLVKLVRHARENSPFYRSHYRHLPSARSVALEALPTIDKRTIMDNFDRVVTDRRLKLAELEVHIGEISCDSYYLDQYRVLTTGGTTGIKGLFVYDRRAWRYVLATLLRWSRFMNASPRLWKRVKVASVGSNSVAHASCRAAMSADVGLYRIARLNATDSLASLVAGLNAFQPELLSAYPSIASLLAIEQLEGRLRIAPRVVSTGSELCTARMAERMQSAWHTHPFDNYALVEGMLASAECGCHEGIHIFEDLFILEVVDSQNRPVPAGTRGHKVLLTNLFNFTQPLIRYEVTDMLTLAARPCSCGRPFRLIERVEGRTDDIIRLDGINGGQVSVHPDLFHTAVELIAEIKEYQVIHDERGIRVKVVARTGSDPDAVAQRLVGKLSGALGHLGARIPRFDISFTAHIERDPTRMGKHKLVQSLLLAADKPC